MLAIDAADLAPITFGNAAELKKGQIVISLGNPYAIARDGQASAAWGIVANLARKAPATPSESDPTGRPTLHHYGTLIQTDAKLNLGTSGGPLLNLKGEMVGLSVALAATAGYEAAGGYAIPVDATFRRAVETLMQGREVEYGFLGVQPVNLRQQEVLGGLHGMRVAQVVRGTPAARSGLKPDDIVTAVDGAPIYDADGLVLNVGKLPPEAVARLSVLRGGSPRTVEVTLTKYAVRGKKIVTAADPAWRGLRVEYPTAVVDEKAGPRRHVVCRRCGHCHRSGRRLAGLGGGPASRHVHHPRRPARQSARPRSLPPPWPASRARWHCGCWAIEQNPIRTVGRRRGVKRPAHLVRLPAEDDNRGDWTPEHVPWPKRSGTDENRRGGHRLCGTGHGHLPGGDRQRRDLRRLRPQEDRRAQPRAYSHLRAGAGRTGDPQRGGRPAPLHHRPGRGREEGPAGVSGRGHPVGRRRLGGSLGPLGGRRSACRRTSPPTASWSARARCRSAPTPRWRRG